MLCAVGTRTVVDSVVEVSGPPENRDELERLLEDLRRRFPGANLQRYLDRLPEIAPSAHVAPGAALFGKVRLAEGASVWPGCVLRGDLNDVSVGRGSNVQDGTVIHVGDRDPAIVGADVVIGHRAVVHGCTIEDAVLIGIQSTVLDGAIIGAGSVVGAGAVVTAGTRIPPRSLVLGIPGRVTKTLTGDDEAFQRALAAKYRRLAHNYKAG